LKLAWHPRIPDPHARPPADPLKDPAGGLSRYFSGGAGGVGIAVIGHGAIIRWDILRCPTKYPIMPPTKNSSTNDNPPPHRRLHPHAFFSFEHSVCFSFPSIVWLLLRLQRLGRIHHMIPLIAYDVPDVVFQTFEGGGKLRVLRSPLSTSQP
jgi:hypothetical protein